LRCKVHQFDEGLLVAPFLKSPDKRVGGDGFGAGGAECGGLVDVGSGVGCGCARRAHERVGDVCGNPARSMFPGGECDGFFHNDWFFSLRGLGF